MTTKPDAAPAPLPIEYGTAPARTSAQSDDAVEAWFLDYFHGVPGLTTEQFNRFREAADQYKARLSAREQ